jgi:RNA polymerase sigma-70 factor (ECF subfamily)
MTDTTDAEALRDSRRDPEAICVLYDRYAARLVAAVARTTGDRELAFDVVQETFARALERGHRVRLSPDGSAWPWLWRVARNLVTDARRRGAVDRRARERLGIATVRLDVGYEDAIARADADALGPGLAAALADLDPLQRAAVDGRVSAELGYDALARMLGTSEAVARARVSRGLRALRMRLSGGRP